VDLNGRWDGTAADWLGSRKAALYGLSCPRSEILSRRQGRSLPYHQGV